MPIARRTACTSQSLALTAVGGGRRELHRPERLPTGDDDATFPPHSHSVQRGAIC